MNDPALLLMIVAATAAGGVLSVIAAALIGLVLLQRWLHRLVSFAVGVLLAAALMELMPRAANELGYETAGAWLLGGILLFFVLEKFAMWRHDHAHEHADAETEDDCTLAHTAEPVRPSAWMILIGDGVHNFVDGILIAAAFLQEPRLGVAATVAVLAHEIPQEIGDFAVLIAGGMSRSRALLFNALSGMTAVIGGVLGYFVLAHAEEAVPYALTLAAASFIYIAVADLVPELHRHRRGRVAIAQIVLMIAGIAVVAGGHLFHTH